MPAAAEPPKPRILVVEDESEVRARIRGELERRYGSDYRVRCVGSATDALARLEGWREAGDPVALVLADQWMPDMLGEDFLACARALYPGRQARAAREVRRLGAPRHRRRDVARHGPRQHRLLRPQAVAARRRVLPSHDHRVPAGMGARELGRAAGGGRGLRVALAARAPAAAAAWRATACRTSRTTRTRPTGGASWRTRTRRAPASRWWSSRAARCWSIPPTPSLPTPTA